MRALRSVRTVSPPPDLLDRARFRGAGVAPTGWPQNETSPIPQRMRLAAEDAWPARAAAKGLLMTLAATASKEELLVSQCTPRPGIGHRSGRRARLGTAPSPPPRTQHQRGSLFGRERSRGVVIARLQRPRTR